MIGAIGNIGAIGTMGLGFRKAENKPPYVAPLSFFTPTASLGYSLRKLSNTYTGSAIRVRRSSDNAEADIGFAGDGWLDEAALLAFVGSNDAHVRTMYDQTGNGNDAIQTSTDAQPSLVVGGVIQRANARPAIWHQNSEHLNLSTRLTDVRSTATVGKFMSVIPATTESGGRPYPFLFGDTSTYPFHGYYNGNNSTVGRLFHRSLAYSVRSGADKLYLNNELENINMSLFTTTSVLAIVTSKAASIASITTDRRIPARSRWGYFTEDIIFNQTVTDAERIAYSANAMSAFDII